jgi:hypothetical protein
MKQKRRYRVFMPYTYYANRYMRLYFHLIYPFYKSPMHVKVESILDWIVQWPFYLLDLLFLPEIYLALNLIFKKDIRRLNDHEKKLMENFYGQSIVQEYVFVDNRSSLFTKKHKFAYVSFNLINYWHEMRDEILIHEFMHVYQFQKFGFVYVYKAWKAQFSKEGYDYGGEAGLRLVLEQGKSLFHFNFEQQASIVEHFFVLLQRPNEGDNKKLINLYKAFYEQLF